ncbi:MAG: hypothetical protein JEZ03_12560 [Bacteroidales bacterium]|nr:hypothetical protein [Bacteroidales bacterium]
MISIKKTKISREKLFRVISMTAVFLLNFKSFAQDRTIATDPGQNSGSMQEVAYAIPFIIILGVLYIMKNARRKMITFGVKQLPLMTSISLLTGSGKDSGTYWKIFKDKNKGNSISGKF